MKNEEVGIREVLAKELIDNNLNSLNPKDYLDGISGMNLVTILQMLIELSVKSKETGKYIHILIDEMFNDIVLNAILHNTVKDYYL